MNDPHAYADARPAPAPHRQQTTAGPPPSRRPRWMTRAAHWPRRLAERLVRFSGGELK